MRRPTPRRWFTIAAASLLLGGLAVPAPAAATTDADGVVYGSIAVTDVTGAPLEEAYVVLEPVDDDVEQVIVATDADGIAAFTEAPVVPTAYRVRVTWSGVGQGGNWYRLADGFSSDTGPPLPTLVSSSPEGARLDATMPVTLGTGSISGMVLTALGNVVPDARVEVRRDGGVGWSDGSGFATSDASGRFTVPHVTAGTFEVWASCTCGGSDAPFGSMPSPRVVLTIADGEAVHGVEVRLGAKGRLSGSLLTERADGTQTTLADPTRAVVVYPVGKPPTRQYASFVVLFAPDGSWSRDLEPGEYQVAFGRYLAPVGETKKVFVPDQYHAGEVSPSGATIVTVEPAIETPGIDAVYPDAEPPTVGPVQRSIVVADQDGTPVSGAVAVVTSIASGESFPSRTDPSGYSSFHAAPYLPTLAEVRVEYRQDTWVYTEDGFVPATAEPTPAQVWIQAGGGEGVIQDRLPFRLGTGTVEGIVSAGWSETDIVRVNLATASGDVIESTWPGASGQYAFHSVPDGAYRVFFDHPDPDPEQVPFGIDVLWYRDASNLADAAPIAVAEGETEELDAQVVRARGRISGSVVEVTAGGVTVPLADRTVAVYPEASGPTAADARHATVRTDGSWSVDLAPGMYDVAFGRLEVAGDPATFVVEQYFDGTASASEAVPVEVVDARELDGIDGRYPLESDPTPTPLSTPTLSGSAVVGSTLTALATSETPGASLEYVWLADGSPIADASGRSFELGSAQLGKAIAVRVIAAAVGHSPTSKESVPSDAVIAGTLTTSTPTIHGAVTEGETLSADPGAWTPGTAFAFEWFADGVSIEGVDTPALKLGGAQVGASITVRVTGTKPGYKTALATSAPTSPVSTVSTSRLSRDFSGDERPDVLVRTTNGAMKMYVGNGASGWKGASTIGSGWTVMNHVFAAGDFSGDGHEDVMARDGAGRLHLYRGDGKGGWLGSRVVGTGWGQMTAIFSPGDFSGDGNVDVMARDAAGGLWLYRGDGRGGWGAVSKIGSGWNRFDRIFAAGDFGGAGGASVMARTPSGELWVYPSSGDGAWKKPARVGVGWGVFNAVFGSGDFDGDGHDDVMGRDAGGRLWLYPGRGGLEWGARAVVGTGWGGLAFVS